MHDGVSRIGQAALTGESIPVTMGAGDMAKMGSTVMRGEIEAIASATGAETFFGKTAALVQGVDELDNLEKTSRAVLLLIVSVSSVVSIVVLIYLCVIGVDPLDALRFCVVLLISSIPLSRCAWCA